MQIEARGQTMVDWGVPPSEASTERLLYEIGMGVLITISGIMQVIDTRISWLWFGVGVFAVVLTHAASDTPPGLWAEKWFKRIGIGGRLVAIVIAAFVIWGSIWYFEPPAAIIPNLVTGAGCIIIGISLFRFLKRIRSNERRNPV